MVLNLGVLFGVEGEFDSWKLGIVARSGNGGIIRVPFGRWKSQDLRERNGPRSGFEVGPELAGILKPRLISRGFHARSRGLSEPASEDGPRL